MPKSFPNPVDQTDSFCGASVLALTLSEINALYERYRDDPEARCRAFAARGYVEREDRPGVFRRLL